MLMEKTRRGGKNSIDQFTRGAVQTDLDRMDALAITTLCLRVAFSVDNLFGYVPLWADDPVYINERAREEEVDMPMCRCSNCDPAAAEVLVESLLWANIENFDDIMTDSFTRHQTYNISSKCPSKASALRKQKFNKEDAEELDDFAMILVTDLNHYYDTEVAPGGRHRLTLLPSFLFGKEECDTILASLEHINKIEDMRGVIGGECFTGQYEWLFKWIVDYKANELAGRPAPAQPTHATKKARSSPSTSKAATKATRTQQALGNGNSPQPMNKKALEAERRQHILLDKQAAKKAMDFIIEKRKIQVAQIMKDTLKEAAGRRETDSAITQSGEV
ncbi:hypothetical protein PSTG_08624 [Puccinia striiformis f. sp. tritici PST-78]|uniref:Uncharacterized protein n=1 Tax=Puccinia striiformis f. sp. tritici PST-78 TaxID=1165861 RepID=A0A0L0VFT2_9BASI|nr:hypothetical protein PSTG_08624 [Puccinia striiformis f. sp. tritici PST-78]